MVRVKTTGRTIGQVQQEPFGFPGWSNYFLRFHWLIGRLARNSNWNIKMLDFGRDFMETKNRKLYCFGPSARVRTFEKIVCVEGFQNTILACLLDRFNNLIPDLDTFCHLVWNKIHNHWGLTTKTRVHRGRTAHSIDHVSRILPLTSLKECFYYFAKWLTGKETLFFNTSYNRTKISYFFSVFSVRKCLFC